MNKKLFSVIADGAVVVAIAVATAVFFITAPKRDSFTYITKTNDLYGIRNNLSGNYKVGADFDATLDKNWIPIGTKDRPFAGVFDGKGCTIRAINLSARADVTGLLFGMFGYVTGIIKNVSFYCVDEGTTYDISSKGSSSNFIGGFLCAVNEGQISNCKVIFSSTLTFAKNTKGVFGGIAGISKGFMSSCSSHGTIYTQEGDDIKFGSAIGERYYEEQIADVVGEMNFESKK